MDEYFDRQDFENDMQIFEEDFANLGEDEVLCILYCEFVFERWPALRRLDETARQRLFAAIEAALATLNCTIEAINIYRNELHLVSRTSENHSIDEVTKTLEQTACKLLRGSGRERKPKSYRVASISPSGTISAVIRVRNLTQTKVL